jgi:hypothetical protein
MNISFGIITNKSESDLITTIRSIEKQNIPNYEIIIVGGFGEFKTPKINHIPFNEELKNNWITRKKNIITENANFDNIVYLHDYLYLSDDWYQGHLISGDDFEIRMDRIINKDNTRFRDWCLWPDYSFGDGESTENTVREFALLPYHITDLNRFQYISGSYWVAKKSVMLKNPLDENLSWGESEDVEWSKRVRLNHKITMNNNSSVYLNKQKPVVFKETTDEIINYLKQIS